jgi:AmmeMemoRadiSam system protein A
MELMSLKNKYNPEDCKVLLKWAKASIQHGLETGRPIAPNLPDFPTKLTEQRATFVTLEKIQQLRGCIGMLQATRPLVEDIANNAFAAAFKDPRFPALKKQELEYLDIHISILSPSESLTFSSEQDLLAQLRPGLDGLILEEGSKRGTFLPTVWESLSEPKEFLTHLKQKAGLPENYWSDTLKIQRYTTELID